MRAHDSTKDKNSSDRIPGTREDLPILGAAGCGGYTDKRSGTKTSDFAKILKENYFQLVFLYLAESPNI